MIRVPDWSEDGAANWGAAISDAMGGVWGQSASVTTSGISATPIKASAVACGRVATVWLEYAPGVSISGGSLTVIEVLTRNQSVAPLALSGVLLMVSQNANYIGRVIVRDGVASLPNGSYPDGLIISGSMSLLEV